MYDTEIYTLKIENYLVFVAYMWFDAACWIIHIHTLVAHALDKKNIKTICQWIHVYKFYLAYYWLYSRVQNYTRIICYGSLKEGKY